MYDEEDTIDYRPQERDFKHKQVHSPFWLPAEHLPLTPPRSLRDGRLSGEPSPPVRALLFVLTDFSAGWPTSPPELSTVTLEQALSMSSLPPSPRSPPTKISWEPSPSSFGPLP